MRAHLVPLSFVASLLACLTAAASSPVTWTRDASNPTRVSGRVELEAATDAVWTRMRDVESWPRLFSDIRALKVKSHEGNRWVLRLDTVAMDCGPHDYIVQVHENRTISIDIDAPGLGANAVLGVRAGVGDGSVGTYEITVRIARILSWFVSEKELRTKQERMLLSYLEDFARAFGGAKSTSAP